MAKKDFMAAFLREREQSEAVSKLDTVNVTPLATNMIGESSDNFYHVDDIDDLVESIREHGLLHPIVTNNGTTVISGHRRLAAYRRLLAETGDEKYKMIPCIVLHPADPIESEMMMIEANSTARVLTPYELMEQAKRYDALLVKAKEHGYECEGRRRDIVAKMMKVSPAKVGRYAAIDKHLDESWKSLFQQGEISESVAYEISKMDMDTQESMLDIFLDDDGHVNVTLADVQHIVEYLQKEKKNLIRSRNWIQNRRNRPRIQKRSTRKSLISGVRWQKIKKLPKLKSRSLNKIRSAAKRLWISWMGCSQLCQI